ncbi:Wall-associated receptor kinase-like 2 [Bienertia sinuspersici]
MNYSTLILFKIIVLCSVLTRLITGDDKTLSHTAQVIAPHCSDKCGNVTIPYPFGIEDGCYYNDTYPYSSFNITCNHNTNPPTPYIGTTFNISDISVVDGELRTSNYVSSTACYNQSGYIDGYGSSFLLPTFTLSRTKNMLVAIGCDTRSTFSGVRGDKKYETGCVTRCFDPGDVIDGDCNGVGCCHASILNGLKNISITVSSYQNHSLVYSFNPCSVAFLVAKDAFKFYKKDLSHEYELYDKFEVPVVFSWTITGQGNNCSAAKANRGLLCKENAECYDPEHEVGYRCKCKHGLTNNIMQLLMNAGVCASLGSTILLLIGWWLYTFLKRRQIVKQQKYNFEKNGGLLLQQQMCSNEGVIERIKIFTTHELMKATDNFNEDRILGQGGHGTVYKGMLDKGRIIAVKKSNKLEESQEFINEVVVLSQINHRNILKLLGCCLETEVPLLVYEFIPNGTLFHHIHSPSEEFTITWKMRLQIASDTAGALAYLHSSTSTLIFHRDIKSSNILLDEKYRAKLSDFGTSRSVDVDQTHVVTRVMGTFGYLDPEYFRSHQFTEKSDVYSFGVVLVELLTGQKAVRAASEEDRSLTSWFLSHMENSCVFEIIDPQVLQEGTKEEFMTIANLAKRCLHLDGKRRPTMKEVLLEIEAVLSFHMPQTHHPNTANFEQVVNGATTTSTCSSTFNIESRTLDSAELSLLFNPR